MVSFILKFLKAIYQQEIQRNYKTEEILHIFTSTISNEQQTQMCVTCGILHCVRLLMGSTHMGSFQHDKCNDSQTSTVDFIPNTSNSTPPHTFRRVPLNTVTPSDWKSKFQFFSCQLHKTHSTV